MKTNKKLLLILSLGVLLPTSLTLSSCDKNDSINSTDSSNKGNSSVEILEMQNPFKSVYGVGVIIDFGNINFSVNLNGENLLINGLDSRLTITGGDTEIVGTHQIDVTFQGKTFSFSYEVKQFYVTLDFNSGTYEDKESVKLPLYNNRVDISDYLPISSEGETVKSFSGWYYDKECTSRAAFALDKEFKSEQDVTLYAGYDLYYDDQFTYVIDTKKNTATLVSLNFAMLDFSFFFDTILRIPSTIKGYPVTEIGSDFLIDKISDPEFGDDEIDYATMMFTKDIVFDEGSQLEKIGDRAFRNLSSLTSIEFPESLNSIGTEAFTATSLTGELHFGKNLTKIGSKAFSYDVAITDVTFEEGSKIKIIGESAFLGDASIHSVEFPNGLEEIREEAFAGCTDLASVKLPASISLIGAGAFKNMSSLSEISVDENNKNYASLDGNLYSKNMEKLIRYCYKEGQTSFSLPASVVSLGDSAFTLFSDFTSLNELKLNEGLSYIGKEVFSNCIFDIELPKSLNSFSLDAFKGYAGSSIKVREGNDRYASEDGILYSADFKTLFSCPGDYHATHFVLRDSVKKISNNAFYKCDEITSFKIGKNSALEEVAKNGLLLSSMNSLKYLDLEKIDGISFKNDSISSSEAFSNTNYIVVLANEEDKNKFVSSLVEGDSLTEKVYSKDEVSVAAKEAVENCFEISFDSFDTQYEDLFKTIDVLLDDTKRSVSLTSYLFDNGLSEGKEYQYYSSYYEMLYLSLYAKVFLEDSYSLVNNGYSLSYLNSTYQCLPTEVKEKVKLPLSKMNEKYKFINEEEGLKQLYRDILSFKADKNTFDAKEFALIEERAKNLQLENAAMPSTVYEKYLLLKVDNGINEILKTNLDAASVRELNDLYIMIKPCQENDYSSIQTIIDAYFGNSYRKEKVYHYDEYEAFIEKFAEKFNSQEDIIKEKIENFDFTSYNYDEYYTFYKNEVIFLHDRFLYSYYDVEENANLIFLNIAINDFHQYDNDGLDDSDFADAYCYANYVNGYMEDIEENTKIHEYDYFFEMKEKIETYAEEYASKFTNKVNSFEISKENLTKEKVDDLYNTYSKFISNLLIQGEDLAEDLLDETTYLKYNAIMASYIIQELLAKFPTVTAENAYSLKKALYGYYGFSDLTKHEGYESYINTYLAKISDYDTVLGYDNYEALLSGLLDLENANEW